MTLATLPSSSLPGSSIRRAPADVVINIHNAYRRPEFRTGHCACFHTGASVTADIEGVLIHGAQSALAFPVTDRKSWRTHLTSERHLCAKLAERTAER